MTKTKEAIDEVSSVTKATSSSNPIRVDFVPAEELLLSGRLGMTFAPGKRGTGASAVWNRDLDADLDRIRHTYRASRLVCLLEAHEMRSLGIAGILERASSCGLEVDTFPIRDGGVPADVRAFDALVARTVAAARDRSNVVVHCRGGLGRTGLLAACCLVSLGKKPEDALRVVRTARSGAVETRAQEQWIRDFAQRADVDARTPRPRIAFDRVLGCLLGGAIGDSLGYPVEFMKPAAASLERFGSVAPVHLLLVDDRPRVSDDTQMTLFSAEGIIRARQRAVERGIVDVATVVQHAYLRWFATQEPSGEGHAGVSEAGWLVGVDALHARRAPGLTCLSALRSVRENWGLATIEFPLNDSKGCGAVVRSAPFGLAAGSREEAFGWARDAGVLTHGHPAGFLSAAYFASLVFDLAHGIPLLEAVAAATGLVERESGHEPVVRSVARALELARRGPPSPADIEALGGGWVGEEALAIALVCALTNEGSEPEAIAQTLWRSVAHSGDSDSTGSLTGNLLGVIHGAGALPVKWAAEVELREVIGRLARDLFASAVLGVELDFESYPPN